LTTGTGPTVRSKTFGPFEVTVIAFSPEELRDCEAERSQ
jgi:hypothetical protein